MKKNLYAMAILIFSYILARPLIAQEISSESSRRYPDFAHCKDSDGDGFYKQPYFCGIPDCDDKDPNIKPLVDGAVIDSNFVSCGNMVELTQPIIVKDGASLDCNQSALYDVAYLPNGIEIVGSGVTVKNCYLEGFVVGISDGEISTNNIITDNTFYGIEHTAIKINYNTHSVVKNNVIKDSRNGISIRYSDFNTIESNFVDNAESYGIYTYYANNNDIIGNEINNSGRNEGYTYRSGISLGYVNQNNLIKGNILRNNSVYNVNLRGRLPEEVPINNIIVGNYIYETDIFDVYESGNTYCFNGEENYYFDGASGPVCD